MFLLVYMVFEGEGESQKWTSGFERVSSALDNPSDTAIKGVDLLLGGVVGVYNYLVFLDTPVHLWS